MKVTTKPFGLKLLALSTVFAMVVVACSDDDSTTTEATQPPATTAEATQPPATTAAPEPKILKVAVTEFGSEVFDPAADVQSSQITSAMFETALRIDADGQVAPGIVTKWEASPDGATWTLTMRDDVVFHDGTPVTTEDLAFAYQRAVLDSTDERDIWRDMLGEEPNIDIVSDTQIMVHTNGPQPLFIPMSTLYGSTIFLVPKAYIEENGIDFFMENPIGTGPFQFVKHDLGTEMEFKAVDYDHWRINPEFSSVRVILTPEPATAVAQLQTGELDMAPMRPEDANELGEAFQIITGSPQQIYLPIIAAMAPENEGSPLSDVRVRRALSLGINRQELIDAMFPGVGATLPGPIRASLNHMPDVTDALREKWSAWAEENYRYDPDEAKRLLAEAGFPDGFTFEFWSVPDAGAPYLSDVVQVLAGYWREIGVIAEVRNVSDDAYDSQRGGRPEPAFGVMATKASSLAKASAGENVASNHITDSSDRALIGSPDEALMDQVWQEYLTSVDPALQESTLDMIFTIATRNWTQLPVVHVPDLFAFGPQVGPVTPINNFNFGDFFAEWTVAG